MKIKLEAGKSYFRRDGKIEKIIGIDGGFAYNEDGRSWLLDGSFLYYEKHDFDLVSEAITYEIVGSFTGGKSMVFSDEVAEKAYEITLKHAMDRIEDLEKQLAAEKNAQEQLAIRILGKEQYENSSCQAHPLELVENAYNELLMENSQSAEELEWMHEY